MVQNDYIADYSDFVSRNPLRTVELPHGTWRFLDNGREDRPVLVLLHGSRGNAYVFWRQFQGLGDDFRLISVGLPLHDDAADVCADLAQLLTLQGVDKINILGSSIGGYFAQWFTHFHPDRVGKLFISSSVVDGRGFNNPSPIIARFVLPFVPYPVIMRRLAKLETRDAKYQALIRFLEEKVTGNLSSREIAKRASAFHVSGAVPPLNIPNERITIIDCLDEPYVDQAAQQRVIERYPGAGHTRLNEGHHFPYIVVPEQYNAIVREAILAS